VGAVIDVNDPPGAAITAVLLHPHPHMGGDRFNHVVDSLYRALPTRGFRAVRFDFTSADVALAAAQTVEVIEQSPLPVVVVGYSFGAGVAVHATHPSVRGWALVAPYIAEDAAPIATDPRPKLIVVAERDQWSPPARVEPLVATWENTTLMTLPGADHFLLGATGTLIEAAVEWLQTL